MLMESRRPKSRRFSRTHGRIGPGRDGSRLAVGMTSGGRYLRVIYIPDPEPASVFVVTAYDLIGKPLSAFPAPHETEKTMKQSRFPKGWDEKAGVRAIGSL